MSKICLSLLLAFILISCKAPKEDTSTGDASEILGKVYDVVATRASSAESWYVVNGKSAMALEQGDTEKTGAGLLSFFNYYEPQFCALNQVCICNGSARFSFDIKDATQTNVSDQPPTGGYNVFDPYVNPTETPATSNETDPTQEIYQVFLYDLNINPETVSLSENCQPQVKRSVRLIRYKSGELIMQDTYRDVLLRPRVY